LKCLVPGCGGRLARWGFGRERDVVGLGGVTGRVFPDVQGVHLGDVRGGHLEPGIPDI